MHAMKRWSLIGAAIGLALLFTLAGWRDAAAQQRVQQLADALLLFEENVTWSAVAPDWGDKRDEWIGSVQAAAAPEEVAAQVLALEESMRWRAVEAAWRERRPDWVNEMQRARADRAVARGLLELEQTTRWSAVAPEWRRLRDGWVAGLESIR